MKPAIAILALVLWPAMAQAQAYEAINRLLVVPIDRTTFEVIEARGEGARGIWCAAANYVRRNGLRSADGRIYVQRARGPSVTVPGRKGVVFTLRPDAQLQATPRSLSVSVRRVGENLSVNHAHIFCDDYILELREGPFGDRF
ncbi:hypothetical protein [Sulfitobacter sabulilitoris]|uniref:Uncharacterized protein n=1 Tax=Sulfitobacter sabulilitoris TaxID=2562655 RepID=A0A5S3PL31_9RHOB|nr:hypothetical protein [Sulfitobacter sabulilitoris]TMM55093.1 hypothetical protein FDT80_05870 [Sulfitobacter sabulilitoris]